jgi:hypothetical protein
MVDAKLEDTVFLGDIIERSIDNDMKEGNTQDVQKTIASVGKNKEVMSLRILSPDGTILKSKNAAELGRNQRTLINPHLRNLPKTYPYR